MPSELKDSAAVCRAVWGKGTFGLSVLHLYTHQVADVSQAWSRYIFADSKVFADGMQIAHLSVFADHVGVLEVNSDLLVQILYSICEGHTSGEEEP